MQTRIRHIAPALLALFAFLFVTVGCVEYATGNDDDEAEEQPQVPTPPGYELVWQDEFDAEQIDLSKWSFEVNANGGGNNELQYYTDRSENARIEEGELVIEAHAERYTGPEGTRDYTSARLRTLDRGDWTYGQIEVRAKLPSGRGTWPAIWMLPTEWRYGGWPESGEIDIMEHVGYDEGVVHGTVHTEAYNHRQGTQRGGKVAVPQATADYHIYAIEWTPEAIHWYVDGQQYYTFLNERLEDDSAGPAEWPFDQPFHLLLNIAVGGDWGGAQGVASDIWPQQMRVDYVRVFQKTEDAN